jgi:hypothetical protein
MKTSTPTCCGLYSAQYGCKTHQTPRARYYRCCMLWTNRYGCQSHGLKPGQLLENAAVTR